MQLNRTVLLVAHSSIDDPKDPTDKINILNFLYEIFEKEKNRTSIRL